MNIKSIELLLASISQGVLHVKSTDDGWMSGIKFPYATLDDRTQKNLVTYFTGELEGDFFIHWIADNNEDAIVFEDQEDAVNTTRLQIPHIEKRIIFSIYQKTGVVYQKPKGNVVSFHSRK